MPWRKALAVLAVLATLFAAYAAAGTWLAPRYLREALVERAAQAGVALSLDEVRTDPFRLRVDLAGVTASAGEGLRASAPALHADLAWSSLWRDHWVLERISIVKPRVRAEGRALFGGGAGDGGAAPAVRVQELVLEEGTLQAGGIELTRIAIRIDEVSTARGEPGSYSFASRIAGDGTLSSQGSVSLSPLDARGELSASAVPVKVLWRGADAPAGRLGGRASYTYQGGSLVLRDVSLEGARLAYAGVELPQALAKVPVLSLPPREPFEITANATVAPSDVAAERVALRVASGSARVNGRLDVSGKGFRYDGAATLAGLRLEEAASGALLLAFERGHTDALSLGTGMLAIGELALQAPQGRIVIDKDGGLNFAAAFRGGPGGGGAFRASVERLALEGGTLHFADRSLASPFEAQIEELAGEIAGFDTAAGDPARVALAGRVAPSGTVRIEGTLDLDAPEALTDITARFRDLRLVAFNPYVAKFAGYRIESGRVSATLRYEVKDGRLQGTNRLAFQQMQLGEKVQSRGAADLPLELLVALLADPQGRINLDIPVSGNLSDPEFDFGAIVAQAIGNAVGKIVSAPFRAIAGLLGGNGSQRRESGEVRFAPGSASLTPAAKEDVTRMARALAARPRLALTVRGAYDPQRDVRALRTQIAQASGLALEDVPESDRLARRLAAERAAAVRKALIEAGVDPSRVRIGEAAERRGSEAGVPTPLELGVAR